MGDLVGDSVGDSVGLALGIGVNVGDAVGLELGEVVYVGTPQMGRLGNWSATNRVNSSIVGAPLWESSLQ